MADQQQPLPESQKERWIKYGANVALVSIVAIILAGLITYLAQRTARRWDTTAGGAYSLKPQTVNLIKDNKQKVKLVSLYTADTRDEKDRPIKSPYAEPVADLLDEYRRKGSNIDVQTIDPVSNPKQVDELVGEAINKYGGQVKAYADFVSDFKKTLDDLKQTAATEAAAANKLSTDKLGNSDRDADIATLIDTIRRRPQGLETRAKSIDRELKERHPDYKKVTDAIQTAMESISQSQDTLVQYAEKYKSDNTVPQDIRTYLAESIPRQKEIKAKVEDVIKKIKALG